MFVEMTVSLIEYVVSVGVVVLHYCYSTNDSIMSMHGSTIRRFSTNAKVVMFEKVWPKI